MKTNIAIVLPFQEEPLRYGKRSRILNTFLVLFTYKMLVINDGIHKMLVRIAKMEDPDQTASSEMHLKVV